MFLKIDINSTKNNANSHEVNIEKRILMPSASGFTEKSRCFTDSSPPLAYHALITLLPAPIFTAVKKRNEK